MESCEPFFEDFYTTLDVIYEVFKDFSVTKQKRVGKYAVDLYFEDYNIAVECYEQADMETAYDTDRQYYIENRLSCRFYVYRTFDEGFTITTVLRDLMTMFTTRKPVVKKLPKGDCFFVLKDCWDENLKFKFGLTSNINRVIIDCQVASEKVEVVFLVYSKNCDIIEKSVRKRFNSKICYINDTYLKNLTLEKLVDFAMRTIEKISTTHTVYDLRLSKSSYTDSIDSSDSDCDSVCDVFAEKKQESLAVRVNSEKVGSTTSVKKYSCPRETKRCAGCEQMVKLNLFFRVDRDALTFSDNCIHCYNRDNGPAKQCCACDKILQPFQFGKDKKGVLGLNRRCLECTRAYERAKPKNVIPKPVPMLIHGKECCTCKAVVDWNLFFTKNGGADRTDECKACYEGKHGLSKQCTRCDCIKSACEFGRYSKNKDGLQTFCKACKAFKKQA